MSTLILGCGYLGRRVGRLLASRGEPVIGTVRSRERVPGLVASGIEPRIADVLEPESLAGLPDTDRVLYCVGLDRSAGLPMRTVYVEGLGNVLERLGGRVGRWAYASSTGVYGGNDGGWVDEETPARPTHESGRVCLEAEDLLRTSAEARGLEVVVLRFAGLYGPGRIIRRDSLARGEPIAGDPDKFLNMIHIDDAAAVAVAALDRGGPGRTYLAGDDRPVPRREFYGLIAEQLGAPAPRFLPPAEGSPGARRDESNKRVSNRRMKSELGVALAYPDVTAGIPAALEEERRASS